MSRITKRKLDHLHILTSDPACDRQSNHFDTLQLTHRALPELDLSEIDTTCQFLEHTLSFPLIISSMTGGDSKQIITINQRLAEAAETTGVAMAVGSQRVLFESSAAFDSFNLRPIAPSIPLLANLGAVQLNYEFTATHCQTALDILNADGLYLHLNPLQEAIQPEGNTNFKGLIHQISALNKTLKAPILLKETGCGINPTDIQQCIQAGIQYLDLAGQGGTSWSRIEHNRQHDECKLGLLFQDWGLATPIALQLAQPFMSKIQFIASGGLRNGIDMIKSIILGASLCGIAAPFLKAALQSTEQVIQEINCIKKTFQLAMFLLGIPNVSQLRHNTTLLLNPDKNR
ncbi:MAG: type 2 isopentenyl-diphosphate Delta-isomerase [Endozoicomonadaceae bacterium]|nr:type 2 isopentenyl-diphosphate Delta-isomerase [Endozoicomonadaceae bacterium]MBE8232187.1 type 2 isopentenyl-diphosphate Delta-isomerase [Endozoicomonadaceae bacterium]